MGDRSEQGGRARPLFRSFEENSRSYLTKRIGKMGRSPTGAVDHPKSDRLLGHRHRRPSGFQSVRRFVRGAEMLVAGDDLGAEQQYQRRGFQAQEYNHRGGEGAIDHVND